MRGRELHRRTTIVLSLVLVVLGAVILVRTVTAGAGAEPALGYVMGVALIAVGGLRLYVHRRDEPPIR